jgi:hypothetical protein
MTWEGAKKNRREEHEGREVKFDKLSNQVIELQ